ncbi:MAG: TIGR03943 family protein [Parasynechococcus sp.]
MIRGTLLIIWGWIVLWSVISGRLDLLLRGVFHGLVGVSGAALLLAGVVMLIRHRGRRERMPWPWWSSATIALLVLLVPPNPSFSDLAESRPQGLPEPPELAFVLPPGQRTLTEWVRLLRSQQDPDLVDGNPVNISGFVWTQRNGPPLIARLTVRCCLADATPAGLAVDWPDGFEPTTNQWLAIQGEMAVTMRDEQRVAVVMPKTITPIPRPKRPLEP